MNNSKFIILIVLFFSSFTSVLLSQNNNNTPFNNIILHTSPKLISPVIFRDSEEKKVELDNFKGRLIILNFWTTWCEPCKKEMPSLDNLYQNKNFENLLIFPINMEKLNIKKTKKFFSDLEIKKLNIFFDTDLSLVKQLNLRGVPTTVLVNKDGEEFSRILGEIDFTDKKFLKWLMQYQ